MRRRQPSSLQGTGGQAKPLPVSPATANTPGQARAYMLQAVIADDDIDRPVLASSARTARRADRQPPRWRPGRCAGRELGDSSTPLLARALLSFTTQWGEEAGLAPPAAAHNAPVPPGRAVAEPSTRGRATMGVLRGCHRR